MATNCWPEAPRGGGAGVVGVLEPAESPPPPPPPPRGTWLGDFVIWRAPTACWCVPLGGNSKNAKKQTIAHLQVAELLAVPRHHFPQIATALSVADVQHYITPLPPNYALGGSLGACHGEYAAAGCHLLNLHDPWQWAIFSHYQLPGDPPRPLTTRRPTSSPATWKWCMPKKPGSLGRTYAWTPPSTSS